MLHQLLYMDSRKLELLNMPFLSKQKIAILLKYLDNVVNNEVKANII